MAKEKAKEFIKFLKDNPEVVEKMKGFTPDELKDAAEDLKKEGEDLSEVEPHFPV
ncbi:MAG: hypothetical protein GTO45_00745 [Candidatus Aminicenantes bacterium]|nr:hypothetical protein [Candidatus Aminicenantes bacterium]NIM77290.1 hypothetical protein [Candidatus Aminicenantes bacterium]NIN16591.1 hypothetical protein [Candidatus Aminicenantes bacterium]NIN40449.1 hypothetical protein [Candidatus Aminicenantes bacterium]NIN83269.1 hypothetical protein [Candidatus Aminicenantes bacterium]